MVKKANDKPENPNRREALKIIASTAATVPVLGYSAHAPAAGAMMQSSKVKIDPSSPKGTLSDPDMLNPTIPWGMVLTEPELSDLKILANIIIPKDDISPGAGDLGAQNFINEWVSAHYRNNKRDLVLVRGGLVWLNSESKKRYDRQFSQLAINEVVAICDDIKWTETAKPDYKFAARFFAKVRDLSATAFYTTEEGMADIGYVGNKPLARFDGPPLEVLKHLGLEKYAE